MELTRVLFICIYIKNIRLLRRIGIKNVPYTTCGVSIHLMHDPTPLKFIILHPRFCSKPTTRKGKKVLQAKAPQIIEGPKQALLLQGRKTSETVRKTLKDLYSLKKPDAKLLSRKHDITIFENAAPVEQLCRRSETPVFIMGSHSKKRPDNLVLGRMFNYSLLDMIELGIDSLEALRDFSGPKITLGTKPCLIFNGPIWDQQEEYKHLKSIFIDLFHKEYVETIRLQGFEHALSFTASQDGKILLRSYKVILKKSGCKTPRIELEEIGMWFCTFT